VIVGPNGSGKSNITDAVLWALGEQSPLAVRGQTMQDVIFAGGDGVKGRNAAEVEIVIDNSAGRLQSEFGEISITRRLDRSGEGVYRLNGARCRLVDVIEVLSDSGLGKEMHSVISQGRVDAIVHSKPVDRTALIEEAAGLSKHRKRRHRAQLKLERTQGNLDRALDVEREARSRLRPLKRQAEAAELHARLERQSLELSGRLTQEALRIARSELAAAERAAREARTRRDELEAEQSAVAHRREHVERRLAEHGREREQLSARLFAARSAAERIGLRLESTRETARALVARLERSRGVIDQERRTTTESEPEARLAALESELATLERERDGRLAADLEDVERERRDADARGAALAGEIEAKSAELEGAERALERAREAVREAGERAQAEARREATLEVELERARARERLARGGAEGPSLADRIEVEEGFEAALAAALGGRLSALIVEDLREGARALERSGESGGRALVKGRGPAGGLPAPPSRDALRLLERVRADDELRGLLERLLANAWVVDRIANVPSDFEGIVVTRDGLAYHGALRELRRLPTGDGAETLTERARREALEAQLSGVNAELERARAQAERAELARTEGEAGREQLDQELRDLRRRREHELERTRRAAWLIEQRREGGTTPEDARRRELAAEIAAERRLLESVARERAEQRARGERLRARAAHDERLLPAARRLVSALEQALAGVEARVSSLESELAADEAVGEGAAAELRKLAQAEYDLQARLREASELLTRDEVRVAQIRDREGATAEELSRIEQRLGCQIDAEPGLPDEERAEIEAKLDRIERRRERIGPVNPLAEQEYEEAVAHVEELEGQRTDLEAALAELRGLIRETDRRIREAFDETFEIAARNFEDVIQHLFPGGRGALRLMKPVRPRVVLGGEEPDEPAEDGAPEEPSGFAAVAGEEGSAEAGDPLAANAEKKEERPGIEIEVTPAGKATKRLSLLSGGEKSLVALAFLFAVFIARPCPFYILDEVEAALDDRNLDRFLELIRRYSDRSQFIIITHQRRTMEAADVLYGVSMGGDGVSKVVSRRLEREPQPREPEERLTEAA